MSRVEFSLSLSRKRRALLTKFFDWSIAEMGEDKPFGELFEDHELATIKTVLDDLKAVMETSLPTDWFQRAQHYMKALRMAMQAHGGEDQEDKIYPYLAVLLIASKRGGMDVVAGEWLSDDDEAEPRMITDASEELREMGAFLRLVITHKPQGDDAEMAEIKKSVEALLEDVEKSDFSDRLAAQLNLVVH